MGWTAFKAGTGLNVLRKEFRHAAPRRTHGKGRAPFGHRPYRHLSKTQQSRRRAAAPACALMLCTRAARGKGFRDVGAHQRVQLIHERVPLSCFDKRTQPPHGV